MVNDGRLADSAFESGIMYANVQQKGLTEDGYVRFVSAAAGTASNTSDRAVINVDSIKLQDYPYAVLAYRTNIKCDNVNFNMVTANGTYPATEKKLFFPQARVADGKLQKAYANYKGIYGAAEATDVYLPVWSNSSAVMGADDYFDVKYIAFFKTEKEAKAYNG